MLMIPMLAVLGAAYRQLVVLNGETPAAWNATKEGKVTPMKRLESVMVTIVVVLGEKIERLEHINSVHEEQDKTSQRVIAEQRAEIAELRRGRVAIALLAVGNEAKRVCKQQPLVSTGSLKAARNRPPRDQDSRRRIDIALLADLVDQWQRVALEEAKD
jgi:hypothetical protein